jgi:hypothetical protein
MFPTCLDINGTREVVDKKGYDLEVTKEIEFSGAVVDQVSSGQCHASTYPTSIADINP